MIHRLQLGQVPPKPHTVFEPESKLSFEHCITRQGFDGTYSIVYHRQPPHWIESQQEQGVHPGFSPTEDLARPYRRHFLAPQIKVSDSPFIGRKMLFANSDVAIWFASAKQPDPMLTVNADGDEVVFVFSGKGVVHTQFGVLSYQAGDYVYLPRGIVHRWEPTKKSQLMIIEGRSWIDLPAQYRNASGQLKMDAPYSHRDFKAPQWQKDLCKDNPREVLVKRQDHLYHQIFAHHPFDILGWDGALWPFVFNIKDFQPKIGQVHLPPTVHATFAGGGFLICSFVPRMVDFHERAIPCPYPHSSVDCDELIFYVEGNFTSRKGIGPGSMSLHPMGLPHGPHPGTYEASIGTRYADEVAVMLDTFKPLLPTTWAQKIEDPNYQQSWMQT